MSIYREFLGTETEIENKSLFVRFVERCKLIWSKINFDKVFLYTFVPLAVLTMLFAVGFLCYGIHQNSIDQVNGTKICGEMRYVKTTHLIKDIDQIECFISLNEGVKTIFVENKDKWILTGN